MELPIHQHFHQSVTHEGISFILSSLLNMSSIFDLYLTTLFLFIICFSRHLSFIYWTCTYLGSLSIAVTLVNSFSFVSS